MKFVIAGLGSAGQRHLRNLQRLLGLAHQTPDLFSTPRFGDMRRFGGLRSLSLEIVLGDGGFIRYQIGFSRRFLVRKLGRGTFHKREAHRRFLLSEMP
jgi:hypothetical protein